MSKYTTQLRWIIEQLTYDNKDLSISERISLACPKIFNFYYPIWLEDYRSTLERKILMHYFNKEIGFETVGLWKLYLEERLNLIMPYYNELYKTTIKEYDWTSDTNIKETFVGNKKLKENANLNITGNEKSDSTSNINDTVNSSITGNGTNTTEATKNNNSKNLDSDLPQANYANLDYGTKLTENENTSTVNEQNTTNQNSTEERTNTTNASQNNIVEKSQNNINDLESITDDIYTRERKGASGQHPISDLIIKYRKTLINIDNLIIDELKDLFMTIY